MKALAFAAAVSLTISCVAFAQDSKPTVKPNGLLKQPAEASANIDVAAIQKKIDLLSSAIRKDPKNDAMYGARGQGYKRIGDYERALADLTTAISLNPNRQAYFEIRGNTYGELKRYKEACADYTKALNCGTPTYGLYLRQGQTALLLHDYKAANQSAQSALRLKDDDFEALVLLAGAEQNLGMLSESLKHLSKAIELNPKDGGAFSMRAETYRALGKNDLALQDKLKASQLGFKK